MEDSKETPYRQIEDFLSGNLSEPDAQAVRQRIDQDPDFAREVEFMKFMLGGKRHQKEIAVLQVYHQYRRRRILKIRLIQSGCAVAVMVGVVFLIDFFQQEKPPKPARQSAVTDTIFAEKFQPQDSVSQMPEPVASHSPDEPASQKPPLQIAEKNAADDLVANALKPRSGMGLLNESEEDDRQKAIALMDDGKHSEAMPLLEKHLATLDSAHENFELRIEAAKYYLREKRAFAQAEFHLQKVLNNDANDRLRAEATFHLAIRFLLDGKPDAARPLLEDVVKLNLEPWKSQAGKWMKSQGK